MPTHHETKVLPYTAQQMYDLVADVARYPEFLPWNSAARITARRPSGAGCAAAPTSSVAGSVGGGISGGGSAALQRN